MCYRTYARRVLLSLILLGCTPLALRAQLPASLEKCLPYPTFQQELREIYPADDLNENAQPSGPFGELVSVRIYGGKHMSSARKTELADKLQHEFTGFDSIEDTENEIANLVRIYWVDEGYFRVVAQASLRKTGPTGEYIPYGAIIFVVEGEQYRLGRVTFRSADPEVPLAFPPEQLRKLYPTREGGVFAAAEVREFLEKLRNLYADHGYIDFTSEPRTETNAQTDVVNINMVLDQGKLFRISDIAVEPENPKLEEALRRSVKVGDTFSYSAWKKVLKENKKLLPDSFSESDVEFKRNVKDGTVSIKVKAFDPSFACP